MKQDFNLYTVIYAMEALKDQSNKVTEESGKYNSMSTQQTSYTPVQQEHFKRMSLTYRTVSQELMDLAAMIGGMSGYIKEIADKQDKQDKQEIDEPINGNTAENA